MKKARQYVMASATFSVALGIGFVMQNGDALADRFGADTSQHQPAKFTATTPSPIEAPAVQENFFQSEQPFVSEDVTTPEPVSHTPIESLFVEPVAVIQVAAINPEIVQPEPIAPVSNDGLIAPLLEDAPVIQDGPMQLVAVAPEVLPDVQTEPPAQIFSSPDSAAPVLEFEDVSSVEPQEIDCMPRMAGTAGAPALVNVTVSAPCHAFTTFTIHHEGMMFTAMTDAEGTVELEIPALSQEAVVIAAFSDGDGAVSTTDVPDFAEYERAVLQWRGNISVALNALEGDAEFGENYHIHYDNPGSVGRLLTAEGGYFMRLGNEAAANPLIAEVYTYPTGRTDRLNEVALIAEAEITARNCGRELNAQSLQVSSNRNPEILDLTVTMPKCDAIGDFLILQNMFEDLTIALR